MPNDKHILLFAHGGNKNRGCEALVRATTAILRRSLGPCQISVASRTPAQDRASQLPGDLRFLRHGYAIHTLPWYGFAVSQKLIGNNDFVNSIQYHQVISEAQRSDVCLSIGGDNYCYPKHGYLYSIDERIRKAGKPLALWGCSLERDMLGEAMAQDLRRFDVITARETLTLQTLQDNGLAEKAYLHPDPAFTLEREELPLPAQWQAGNTVGLNVSPMILRHESAPGMAMRAAAALVRHILETSDSAVALIPHVTTAHSNDLEPLGQLHSAFAHTGRVALLGEGYNAVQLKGFISRCRLFVGARTHATIAAYTAAVPTLVVGYSVKARGIARDLFGSDEGLVLPVQALSDEKQLVAAFEGLREREAELRAHLGAVIPDFTARAWAAGDRLKGL